MVPKEDNIEIESYMTLSYCWGGHQPLRLLTDNLDVLRGGMARRVLPRTFMEAMDVAESLGSSYLWIDSLCIVQDSKTDWGSESQSMHKVYGNSACNLAASASRNPLEGLFRERTAADLLPIIHLNWSDRRSHCVSEFRRIPYIFANYENLPLLRRGWVVQERILAPRVLHFAEHQLFWECEEKPLLCEAFARGIPGDPSPWSPRPLRSVVRLSHRKRMLDEVLELWFRVVRNYTRAHLTYDKDKIVAVAGVAALFQQAGDEYLYGCWRSRLIECLCWKTDDFGSPLGDNPRLSEGRRFRRLDDGCEAPTWSWASVIGPVQYIRYLHSTNDVLLLSEPVVHPPDHSASNSTVMIWGPVLKATCRRREYDGMPDRSIGIDIEGVAEADNADCIILDLDDEPVKNGDELTLLLLCIAPSATWASVYGMVMLPSRALIPVGDSTSTTFRRIGHLNSYPNRIAQLAMQQQAGEGANEGYSTTSVRPSAPGRRVKGLAETGEIYEDDDQGGEKRHFLGQLRRLSQSIAVQ